MPLMSGGSAADEGTVGEGTAGCVEAAEADQAARADGGPLGVDRQRDRLRR